MASWNLKDLKLCDQKWWLLLGCRPCSFAFLVLMRGTWWDNEGHRLCNTKTWLGILIPSHAHDMTSDNQLTFISVSPLVIMDTRRVHTTRAVVRIIF